MAVGKSEDDSRDMPSYREDSEKAESEKGLEGGRGRGVRPSTCRVGLSEMVGCGGEGREMFPPASVTRFEVVFSRTAPVQGLLARPEEKRKRKRKRMREATENDNSDDLSPRNVVFQ